jgi:hypothetical protein
MRATVFAILLLAFSACPPPPPPAPQWAIVAEKLPNALLSVWGTSASDVWTVGSDTGDGKGPLVLHFDGTSWERKETGSTGDLWWVFGFADGPVYVGGEGGKILRYRNGTFTRLTTPGTAVVSGIWGATPDDVWAVGAESGGARGAFAWRLRGGDTFENAQGFPPDLVNTDAIWKVWGRTANDVWLVGSAGKTLHWDGTAFTQVSAGTGEALFTVHANSKGFVAVGGFGTGKLVENVGAGWVNVAPSGVQALVGVWLTETEGFAVGQYGSVYAQGDAGWTEQTTGFTFSQSLHSVWVDPSGGVWAAGGNVLTIPLKDGVLVHRGPAVPEVHL